MSSTLTLVPNQPDQDDLVDALGQCAFLVMAALSRVAARHDLSLTQLRVLGILRDRQLRMAELADFLGLERSTLSGLVDRGEARGLMRRGKAEDDGRAVVVVMTAEGRRLAAEVEDGARRALAPMTDRLDRTRQQALLPLLHAMLPADHDG